MTIEMFSWSMISFHDGYVGELGFEFAIPGMDLQSDILLTALCNLAGFHLISREHMPNPIGLDKRGYQVNIFSYFSTKTYIVGTHKKRWRGASNEYP